MQIIEVIDELKGKYPGKSIVLNNKKDLTEILCEIEPTSLHKDHSVAIAVIDKSVPHYHNETTETYEVIKGELALTIDGETTILTPGMKKTILPGQVHFATGTETWVRTTSKPGWKSSDHIIC